MTKIRKLEEKIEQELKDKDMIVEEYQKLNVKKEKLMKDAKSRFT